MSNDFLELLPGLIVLGFFVTFALVAFLAMLKYLRHK